MSMLKKSACCAIDCIRIEYTTNIFVMLVVVVGESRRRDTPLVEAVTPGQCERSHMHTTRRAYYSSKPCKNYATAMWEISL